MALLTKAPRGTQDVLPKESHKWQYLEATLRDTAQLFGFSEIRVPTFEHTELFDRSVGDTTDVVQKEMYTFTDKGDRSITLRPEGTAGTVRSVIENGLLNDALPLKVCYLLSCFRYEKPQAGRLREFHQFGAEYFGAASPAADAELIAMIAECFARLGVEGLSLRINSIGCPECRPAYYDALKQYFAARRDELCDSCRERLEKNPMRILDCKSPVCHEIAAGAPKVTDYLCGDCREHFEGLQKRLDLLGLEYEVDPGIVRGLDYYTRTVFEFVSEHIGAQGTVCGGGRYDGLVEMLGGPKTPALGFAIGLERLLLLMQNTGCALPEAPRPEMYIGSIGEEAAIRAMGLAQEIRAEGFYAVFDTMGRGVKAQMKYADKLGCRYSCILGDDELAAGKAKLKDMKTGTVYETAFEDFVQFLYDRQIDDMTQAVMQLGGEE